LITLSADILSVVRRNKLKGVQIYNAENGRKRFVSEFWWKNLLNNTDLQEVDGNTFLLQA
jgi:hypothetical protein